MSAYSPYTPDELLALNLIHGHELAQNYSLPNEDDTFASMVPKLEAKHGLIDANTMVSTDLMPAGTSHDRSSRFGDIMGSTLIRGVDYPASNPYARAVYLNDANIKADSGSGNVLEHKLSVLDHELNHGQEHAFGGPWRPLGTSRDNSKPHFRQSDEPGQMFNYEGRDSLKMMLERLKRHSQGLP